MDLENRKGSRKNKSKRKGSRPEPAPQKAAAEAAPTDADDGLPVEDYAARHGLAVPEVWRRVRAGELIGRTSRGRLIIYGNAEEAKGFAKEEITVPDPVAKTATMTETIQPDFSDLPPLPLVAADPSDAPGGFLTLAGQRSESPEIALLLDHLSLAKEENREILKLTRDSIRKVTELSDHVVEMKDAVIDAKEAKIQALEAKLKAREEEMRSLQQKNEDLETLSRAILSTNKKK